MQIVRAMILTTALFAVMLWDLTMNNGRGFRVAASLIGISLRQVGLV
jgi:hypothetical protein